jgi:hypothetical protein
MTQTNRQYSAPKPGFARGLSLFATLFLAVAACAQTSEQDWNVVKAGAKGDGQSDCTAAFQAMLDAAGKAGGGVVAVPAGRFRFDGGLSIPANVTLQGVHRVPPTTGPVAITNLTGSVLFAYAGRGSTKGAPFIRLAGNNAAIAGLIIAYPEWKQTDVPPVPYPPCVLSQDTENVSVSECLLLNPYEGIRFVRAHRHLVRNVTGYPIWRGLYVDECYDIGHIENIHFWPFGVSYEANNPYCKWINTQGTAFEFARTDWHYVLNTFCFGYGIGYRFSKSEHGAANGNFHGLGADSCQRAVVVDDSQPPGLLISNGEFVGRWSSTDAVCLEIGPQAGGKVSLVNCSFWGPIDRCVWMRSPIGQFTASACNFVEWDLRGVGSPAIQLDAGKAIVQGCTFNQENLHISVASNVISAILTGNQAEDGFRVENHAGRCVQTAFNEEDSIEWTPIARRHYRIEAGARGDGRYMQGWHGQERTVRPCRWSMESSRLLLPVNPGENYTIALEANIPASSLSPDAGLYVDGQRLASLTNGPLVTVSLPPATGDRMRLELRCKGWVPAQTTPGSGDQRTLGVQLFSITMRSSDSGTNVFKANTGQYGATP